jgi:hypothetical protein
MVLIWLNNPGGDAAVKTNHLLYSENTMFITLQKPIPMKNKYKNIIFIFILFSLSPFLSSGQSWERFDISYSGCSAYFPYEPEWDFSYAEDSSYVWVGEVNDGNIYYGIICVEFSVPFDYDATFDDLNYVAENYLDYLRGEFNITEHTGYVEGSSLESNLDATGIDDYWTDNLGDPWVVKAWIDPYNMAVLYIYSGPEDSLYENKDFFFNNFRFPE